jgi:peptidoglycan/LPS O-acetylase OafA/YrhL
MGGLPRELLVYHRASVNFTRSKEQYLQYRPEIDGLRALAVLPVILFHAGFDTFSGGFIGVDIFFVISGYLITTIILADLNNEAFSITNFYERRARRILPALFFVAFCSVLLSWIWLMPAEMKKFSQSLVSVAFFASNMFFYLKSDYFESATELDPLLHTWSLAVEEQYYVIFPVLLMLLFKLGKHYVLAGISILLFVSFLTAQIGSVAFPSFAFYSLPTRGWELLIGALVALFFDTKSKGVTNPLTNQIGSFAGLVMIAVPIFYFDKHTPFPGFYALFPTVGAAFIIIFARSRTHVGQLLGHKWLVSMGLISYSAYLWHQPIFAFARHRSINELNEFFMLFLIALTLLLAAFSWKFVEAPFRNKSIIGRKQIFAFSIIGSILLSGFGYMGHMNSGFTDRFDNNVMKALDAKNDVRARSLECTPTREQGLDLENACDLGDGKTIGVLVGDSHADSIALALGELLGERKLSIKDMSFSGCSPILGTYRVDDDLGCYQYNKKAYDDIVRSKEISYVIIASRWSLWLKGKGFNNEEGGVESVDFRIDVVKDGRKLRHSESVRQKLVGEKYVETVIAYLKAGKKVILVYPIPAVGWHVPNTLAKKIAFDSIEPNLTTISTDYAAFERRHDTAIGILDSIGDHINLSRLRPEGVLCNTVIKGRCIAQYEGVPLFYDSNHLTNSGARMVIKAIPTSILQQN